MSWATGWATGSDHWAKAIELGHWPEPIGWATGLGHWAGQLDWANELGNWIGLLYHWAGPLAWDTDHWHGQLDLPLGLDSCTGQRNWAKTHTKPAQIIAFLNKNCSLKPGFT